MAAYGPKSWKDKPTATDETVITADYIENGIAELEDMLAAHAAEQVEEQSLATV